MSDIPPDENFWIGAHVCNNFLKISRKIALHLLTGASKLPKSI